MTGAISYHAEVPVGSNSVPILTDYLLQIPRDTYSCRVSKLHSEIKLLRSFKECVLLSQQEVFLLLQIVNFLILRSFKNGPTVFHYNSS